MTRIYGVVLAAGRSRRMGAPKPLLRLDGETLMERAVRVLLEGGCAGVLAVVRDGTLPEAELARHAGARVLVSEGEEQVDSLRVALQALPTQAAGVLVLPVDHPGVSGATARAVVDAWHARRAPIVRPTHDGVPGHPTLFARALFDELRAPDLPEGARTVVARHEAEAEDVPVTEPGVAEDVDTPADVRAAEEEEDAP